MSQDSQVQILQTAFLFWGRRRRRGRVARARESEEDGESGRPDAPVSRPVLTSSFFFFFGAPAATSVCVHGHSCFSKPDTRLRCVGG
jgi:hypothetical protein